VVTSVSHATRPFLSPLRTASRTESEIWSATLSGWPSVTDSDVKEKLCAAIAAPRVVEHRKDVLLPLWTASHQRGGELPEALAFEDAADRFCDRQLDADAAGEVAEHRRGRQPLDHLADLGR